MASAEHVEALRRDGFVVVPGFFPVAQVEQAHRELEACFEKDRQARRDAGVEEMAWEGPCGRSQLSRPSHLLLDVYGRSPAFDAMFERLLTDPVSRGLITALAGPRFKMRGYNVRRMTGAYDPPPAHEWHRDSPGEFGMGIFLTDVLPREHAATALVPGSHLFPYDPRWHTMLPGAFRGADVLKRRDAAARRLAAEKLQGASGAYGRRGDFYLFINDVWHGREPNLHGSQTMVALLGAYPTEFPFPDLVPMPPADVLDALPPAIREVVRQDQEPNTGKDSLLHWTLAARPPMTRVKGDVFYDAWRERRRADRLSWLVPGSAARVAARAAAGKVRWAAKYARDFGPYYARLYPRLAARWVYRHALKRGTTPPA
jgi:hypothetical protein